MAASPTIAIPYLADPEFSPHLRRQARTLCQAGFQVWAIGIASPSQKKQAASADFHSTILTPPWPARRGPLLFLWFAWKVLRLLLRVRPDVIQPIDAPALLPAALAAVRLGVPLRYFSLEDLPVMPALAGRPWRRWLWTALEGWGVKRARTVAVVAGIDASSFRDRYGIPLPFVVRNVPELTPLHPPGELLLRRRFGWGSEERVLMYHGLLQSGRGIELVLPLLRRHPHWRLVVAGFGEFEGELRRLADREQVAASVGWVGSYSHDRLNFWLQDADLGLMIFDHPGFLQALPCKLFECVHAGVPVVSSEAPEMRDYIQATGVGVVVDPANSTALESAILGLLDNPAALDRCREACLRERERTHWNTEAATYRAFLEIGP